MSEIEFTREELANELLALQHEITMEQADPSLVSLFAFTASQFDERVSTEVSEGVIDEVQAIEFEDFRSGIAEAVHQAIKAHKSDIPYINLLNRHRKTPRADAKREAEKVALAAERKVNADRILEEIKAVEAKHAVSSQMLRQSKYIDPTVKPRERNGTWLAHKLEEIVDNGSEIAVFNSDEAKILAGNTLAERNHADIVSLRRDLEQLAKLYEQARFLKARTEPGLFTAISKLRELSETSMFEKRPDLKEVHRFVELLEEPYEDLFNRVVAALDEGPFAHCPELGVLPFSANTERSGKGSLKEIPSDEANEDNILDDVQKAINASGATEYIVEEERITEFVELKEYLERIYPNKVRIYRSLKSNWHPLPWYVIEIAQPDHEPMAVLESPIYGNATYYINNGDWRGTIDFKRKDAQQLGAKPIIHATAEGRTLAIHTNKIKAVIEAGYKA